MEEVVATIPAVVFLFITAMIGVGTALLGIDQIGGSAAIHLGGYRAAQASNVGYGRSIASGISLNYTGADLTAQSDWQQNGLDRSVRADLSYDPQLGWLMGGLHLGVKTGTAGRREEFFPDRPKKFE